MNRFIRIKEGKVATVRLGKSIVEGEIESAVGEPGELYDAGTGTFTKPEVVAPPKPDVATLLADVKALLVSIETKIDKTKA